MAFIYVQRDIETLQKVVKQLKEDKKDLRDTLKNIRSLVGEDGIKSIINFTLKHVKK